MKVNIAHIRERSTAGGWIDFAVFDAKSISGNSSDNESLLLQLTSKARATGLKIDQSSLAYNQGGRIKFFGSKNLVNHLSQTGLPRWTNTINV